MEERLQETVINDKEENQRQRNLLGKQDGLDNKLIGDEAKLKTRRSSKISYIRLTRCTKGQ